jgi:hypothetical protein
MMADLFLAIGFWLCAPLNDAEMDAVFQMPDRQLVDQYFTPKPSVEGECHYRRWRGALAREIALRLDQ